MDLGRVVGVIRGNRESLVEEVRELLRMPSISGTGEGIEDVAGYLRDWVRDNLGGQAELLRYGGGHPIVYGKVSSGSGVKVVFYNMYDVQPVDPVDEWSSPPFEARIVDGKIIARGAYNTKGALMSSLLGMKAFIDAGYEIPVDVVIVLEGEEEIGSRSMPSFVEDKKEELSGAYFTYFSIPSERVKGKPVIVLGNKGIVFVELRSKTSKLDVHSSFSRGLYNPAAVLARIASELIDPLRGPKLPWLEEKTVTPTSEDLKYLDGVKEASPREEIMELYGISETRLSGDEWYIGVYFKPTVNIDGFSSGYTGEGTKTITPGEAVLRLDFRLVPNIEPEDVIEGLKRLIESLGLESLVEVSVLDSYTWSKTDPKAPPVGKSIEAYRQMNLRPYIMPMIPGSAPFYLFTRVLGMPAISTAPGEGGRAHAPDEYITVESIPKIAEYTARLLALAGGPGA